MHARVDVHIIKFVVTNAILIYHWILSLNCRLFVSCMFNWIVYVELYVNPSVDKKLIERYIYGSLYEYEIFILCHPSTPLVSVHVRYHRDLKCKS